MDRELPELNTVIRTFANEGEAHVAQAVLDANGIDSNLIRDDARRDDAVAPMASSDSPGSAGSGQHRGR